MRVSTSSLPSIKLGVLSLKIAPLLDVHPPARVFNALRDAKSWPSKKALAMRSLVFIYQLREEFFIVRASDFEGAEDEGASVIDHGDEESLLAAASFFDRALELTDPGTASAST